MARRCGGDRASDNERRRRVRRGDVGQMRTTPLAVVEKPCAVAVEGVLIHHARPNGSGHVHQVYLESLDVEF